MQSLDIKIYLRGYFMSGYKSESINEVLNVEYVPFFKEKYILSVIAAACFLTSHLIYFIHIHQQKIN